MEQKNLGGRPPKYADENKLIADINDYFAVCREAKEIPNKAGLCSFLHISRDTYNEYKKRFPDALKETESAIENAWVQRLSSNAPTGAIFYLKNAFKEHYKDRNETDITSGGKPLPILGGITVSNDNAIPKNDGAK